MSRAAVLFDLDGTLINSSDAIRTSISRVMVEHGFEPLGPDNIKYFIGVPLGVALTHWTDDVQPMIDRFQEIYMEIYADRTTVFEGVPEMLAALKGKVEMGIITLKGNPETVEVLDHLGLGGFFEHIYGDDGPKRARYPIKPDPGHFFYALWDMGLITKEQYDLLGQVDDLTGREPPFDNTRILFVGDTESDMTGARRAGLRPVGVAWGLRTREQLEAAGAEHVADTPAGLGALLEDLGFL